MPDQPKHNPAIGAPLLSGSAATALIGPKTSAFLCGCALSALGWRLGASWLATTTMGLPLGVWAVLAAAGAARLWETRRDRISAVLSIRVDDWFVSAVERVRSSIPPALLNNSASVARAVLTRPVNAGRSRAPATGRTVKPARIRIGIGASLDTSLLEAHRLTELAPGVTAEWKIVPPGRDECSDCARSGLDALLTRGADGRLLVLSPDHPARPAAWPDWSRRLPLGYATVFPTRIDPALLTLGLGELDSRSARLLVRAAEAAAVLSRCEPRLSVGGRLRGHSALPGFAQSDGPLGKCVQRLAAALTEWSGPEDAALELRRPLARGAQAWLTTWDGQMDPEFRLRAVLACDAVLADEPESLLRVAAARFAAYSDEEGMRQVLSAFAHLKGMPREETTDPLAFVLAEIELGSPGSLTMGRIAAGLGLLWAVAEEESLHYLSDDLMEDLRYASRFIGRDQDLLMVKEVIARLQRVRMDGREQRSANAA